MSLSHSWPGNVLNSLSTESVGISSLQKNTFYYTKENKFGQTQPKSQWASSLIVLTMLQGGYFSTFCDEIPLKIFWNVKSIRKIDYKKWKD